MIQFPVKIVRGRFAGIHAYIIGLIFFFFALYVSILNSILYFINISTSNDIINYACLHIKSRHSRTHTREFKSVFLYYQICNVSENWKEKKLLFFLKFYLENNIIQYDVNAQSYITRAYNMLNVCIMLCVFVL